MKVRLLMATLAALLIAACVIVLAAQLSPRAPDPSVGANPAPDPEIVLASLKTETDPLLEEPVKIRVGKESFEIKPKKLGAKIDLDHLMLVRSSDPAAVPQIKVNQEKLARYVEELRSKVDVAPVNATIKPSVDKLKPVPGEPGKILEGKKTIAGILEAISSPEERIVRSELKKRQPAYGVGDLKQEYPVYLTVSKASNQLYLWKGLKLAKTYSVAVGQPAWPTPTGLFSIQNKTVDPVWHVPNSSWAGSLAGQTIPGGSPENPLKARWMGISDGAGIHGTADVGSLGSAASHGCVRMAVPDVIELYEQVPVGTPIYIQ